MLSVSSEADNEWNDYDENRNALVYLYECELLRSQLARGAEIAQDKGVIQLRL